jgi:hypothetical protein
MKLNIYFHAPGHITPRERAPGTHCVGGRVGPRSGQDDSAGDQAPALQPVAHRYTEVLYYTLMQNKINHIS